MLHHGINTYKDDTNFATVKTAGVGIPFFVGAWPCHTAGGFTGKPQLITSFSDAEKLGGYSEEWRTSNGSPKWTLCMAVYACLKAMAVSPVIVYNVFDPSSHKEAVAAADIGVTDHIATLPLDALDTEALVVKASSESSALVKGTDYDVYYDSKGCYVELLPDSLSYSAATLNIAYDKAKPEAITASDIEAAVEKVEMCKSVVGIVPDLICAPGWSQTASVAAVMAAKAPNINGLYKAKAVVDLDTATADDYADVLSVKNSNGYTSEDMIVCWPMVRIGDRIFDLSVIACAQMAKVDSGNANCPYESPSNKSLTITGACTKTGAEINLTLPQADVVSVTDGVVTVINNGGWVLWGNYTGCYPVSSDVARVFICTSRVQDWICNTFVTTFWSFLDKPMTRVLIDAIVNSFQSWLDGLTAENKLYGGKIEYISDNNPATNLVGGMFRLDTKAASPVPAQQVDMHVTYDVDMLTAALNG